MSEMNIKIDVFEGPLDLLLHLIKQFEVDIYDIPIAEITSQYLAYIHTLKILKLDVAGDYLLMAATLMAIKSQMLLPKPEFEDEEDFFEAGEDPRDALVDQLLEYQQFKKAATILKNRETERSLYYSKEPSDLEDYQTNIALDPAEVKVIDLVLAFQEMMQKKKLKSPLQTKIVIEEVTMEERMTSIRVQLTLSNKPVLFTELFEMVNRTEVVTTFLALLELMKNKEINVKQECAFDDIIIFKPNSQILGESLDG